MLAGGEFAAGEERVVELLEVADMFMDIGDIDVPNLELSVLPEFSASCEYRYVVVNA
jgi:hypothetical protein